MPVISLSSYKGGVGKTTSSIHLAALFSQDASTLLIDSDPNRSATTWARPGGLPFEVCGDREAPKLLRKQNFDYIIIDTPARPSEVEVEELARGCDLLIIPTPPDTLALDATALLSQALPEDSNWTVLLTMIPPRPQKDGEQAMEALRSNGFPVFTRGIRLYKAYKEAATQGCPVSQVKGGGIPWRDWTSLKKEILATLE